MSNVGFQLIISFVSEMLDEKISPGHFPRADLPASAPAEASEKPNLGEIWTSLEFMNFALLLF